MIPAVITDTSITFFAKGRPWNLSADHPKFSDIKQLLTSGSDDADRAIQLTDVRVAVDAATAGQAALTEEGLFLNGKQMPSIWRDKAVAAPDSMKVLLVYPGDRVRVEGDEDAPDGIYTVGEVDNNDADKRVYVESEEDYFGFVANTSIKEIVEEGPRLPAQEPEPEPQPLVEAEDIGCDCNEAGMDSEWNWEPDQNAYVCNGCGEVQ
ncbi:hypothetical protein V1279_002969 [Bradyrhizobium sp. AZCC 1610]|uniref:hypothetical protein n=1 Tax=Bradyrhizobium sp. AZCC 1610 TaxID=3117020 RepID=UPI002FF33CC8